MRATRKGIRPGTHFPLIPARCCLPGDQGSLPADLPYSRHLRHADLHSEGHPGVRADPGRSQLELRSSHQRLDVFRIVLHLVY